MATGPISGNNPLGPLDPPRADHVDKTQGKSDGQTEKVTAETAAKGTFQVEISPEAKARAEAHAKALEVAKKAPDIREDRVADIKAQIAAGIYKPDAGGIADGMLREAIKDRLALDD